MRAYPELVVAIRIGQARRLLTEHASDEDNLCCHGRKPSTPSVAKEIMPPSYVAAVGISAISDEFMMGLWSEIIAVEPDTLDRKGEEYMQHPMWQRSLGGGWTDVREQSYIFGWKGYEP